MAPAAAAAAFAFSVAAAALVRRVRSAGKGRAAAPEGPLLHGLRRRRRRTLSLSGLPILHA